MAGLKIRLPRFIGMPNLSGRDWGRLTLPRPLTVPQSAITALPFISAPLAGRSLDGKVTTYGGAPWLGDIIKELFSITHPPPHLASHLKPYIRVRKGSLSQELNDKLQELGSMDDDGASVGAASNSAQLSRSIVAYRRYNNLESSDSVLSPEEAQEQNAQWEAKFKSQVLKLFPGGVPFLEGFNTNIIPNYGGWIWGRGTFEGKPNEPQGRIYLSVGLGDKTIDGTTFSQAALLYTMLTRFSIKAADNGHGFGFKFIGTQSGLKRGDSAVIYFSSSDQDYLYNNVLLPLSRQGLLKGNTPLFTATLLDPDGKPLTGMAFGQSPENRNESFGSWRARIIDDITQRTNVARDKGTKFSFNKLVWEVANAFREAGINSEFPAFDVGGREVFAFIASHVAMSESEVTTARTQWHDAVRAETLRNTSILEGNQGSALAPDRYADHLIFGQGASLSDYMLGALVDRRTGAILSFGFTAKELSADPNIARVLITMERGEDRHYRVRNIHASKDGKASSDLIIALNTELAGSRVTPPQNTKFETYSVAPLVAETKNRLGIVGGGGQYPEFQYPLPEGKSVDTMSRADVKKFFSRFFKSKINLSDSPVEDFVRLLDLRVNAQLQKKFGAVATVTDMDLEAERNRVVAEILGAGLGAANIPVAKGRVTVTSENGVLIVRPSTEEDYAYIDNTISESGIHSEPISGGFFCNSNAIGVPIIFINPAVGSKAWGVYRHEMQHLRQFPFNRSDPAHTLIGVSLVDDQGNLDAFAMDSFIRLAVDHYLIGARDETLAYFMQGSMAVETVSRLTHSQLYNYIGHHHDELVAMFRQGVSAQYIKKLFVNEEGFLDWTYRKISLIRHLYNNIVEDNVYLLHMTHTTLVEQGYHPEAAKLLLVNHLSRISYSDWKVAIHKFIKALQGQVPQREIPEGSGLDRDRLNLRRRIEKDDIRPVIATEVARIRKALQQVSTTQDANGLQDLRRQWGMGNTLLEQMTEVLNHMTDEYFALQEFAESPGPIDTTLSRLFVLRRMVERAITRSGLEELHGKIDRKLLLYAAHTQHAMRQSSRTIADSPVRTIEALPRLRPTDVAAMAPKNRLSQIIRLRTAITEESDSTSTRRAIHLYATLVRHGDLNDYRLRREFSSLEEIVLKHPDRMPELKLAFAAIRGAAGNQLWNHLLDHAGPRLADIADRDPKFPGMFRFVTME